MSKQIEAIYENGVLRPDEPLDLEPTTRVRVTIETPGGAQRSRGTLRELFGSVDLGYPSGADNESIDADLAREYAGPLTNTQARMELMREAVNDEMFMADLNTTLEGFKDADLERRRQYVNNRR